MMHSKYDIDKMLLSLVGSKGGVSSQKSSPVKSEKAGSSERKANKKISSSANVTDKIIYDDDGAFMPITIGGVTIPYAVMSVTGKKTIVETALVGAKGTVKELISVDDYNLSIAGIFPGEGVYPEKDIRKFMKMYYKNSSLKIESAVAELVLGKGSNRVVIKSISFPPMNGVEDMQAIKMECVTDIPFELIID